jgi:hydrogenase nickel incorporation protein HypB
MCATCGCSGDSGARVGGVPLHDAGHDHDHPHGHGHDHPHDHAGGHDHSHDHSHDHDHDHAREPSATRTIRLEQAVLAKNDLAAARVRGWLEGRGVLALNLVSSPGAGKTTLLERTIRDLAPEREIAVIEGDQETENDAIRVRATGVPVVQVNTGTGCHLDAEMVGRAIDSLDPKPASLLLIENVGNLVCPALFDLGERAKVVVASVTEGEDKPLKYPHMFRASRLLLLNKIDLLPHLDFDVERFRAHARSVNPSIEILEVSATQGTGLEPWYDWLRREGRTGGGR